MFVSWRRVGVGIAFIAVGIALGMWALTRTSTAPTIAHAVPDAGATQSMSDSARAASSAAATPVSSSPPATYTVTTRQIQVAGFGRVSVVVPDGATSHAAVYITGEGAIAPETARIEHIASRGVLVMVLPFDAMRAAEGTVRCWFPAGVIEEIAKKIETSLDWPEYHEPLVIGAGAGAALAYTSLAQAPAGTFAGGIALSASKALPTARPVCGTHDWKPAFDAARHVATLPLIATPPFQWRDLAGTSSDDDVTHAIEAVFSANDQPVAKPSPPSASASELERRLQTLKLSLDDTWAEHPKASLIFMSGDGGWRDIDQHLAAYLAARGVNVVGLSSAVYLWKAKTPPQGGADLKKMADVVADAQVPIFVGGYSLGAEVVPFFLSAWTDADRQHVAGQILIAPSATATFAWSFSQLDWVPFHTNKETAYRVADAVRRDAVPTLCLMGTQVAAANTACSGIGDVATVAKLAGDHHFNGNYDAIGAVVLAFIQKTIGAKH